MSKILIVDDSLLVHKIYSLMVKQLNFDPVSAMNGQEALDVLLSRHDIRLVLLDLNMPVMGGFEFLEKAGSLGITEKIPVVIVSTEDREQILRGLQLGARGFLQKVFSPLELSSLIANLIPHGVTT